MCKFVQHTKNTLNPLTRGKEHYGLRAHYIVTNTHLLSYPRQCETFQDMLFSSSQHKQVYCSSEIDCVC